MQASNQMLMDARPASKGGAGTEDTWAECSDLQELHLVHLAQATLQAQHSQFTTLFSLKLKNLAISLTEKNTEVCHFLPHHWSLAFSCVDSPALRSPWWLLLLTPGPGPPAPPLRAAEAFSSSHCPTGLFISSSPLTQPPAPPLCGAQASSSSQ